MKLRYVILYDECGQCDSTLQYTENDEADPYYEVNLKDGWKDVPIVRVEISREEDDSSF